METILSVKTVTKVTSQSKSKIIFGLNTGVKPLAEFLRFVPEYPENYDNEFLKGNQAKYFEL